MTRNHLESDTGILEKFLQVSLIAAGLVYFFIPAEAAEETDPVDSELIRTVQSKKSPKVSRLYLFKDDLDSCRWIIEEESPEPFDLILDTYLVTASTATPLETRLEVGKSIQAGEEKSVEVRYQFQKPEGDRPVSFLFRLWQKQRDGEKLIDTFLLKLEPQGILERLQGVTVFLHDPEGELKWIDPLREADIRVENLNQSQPDDSERNGSLLIFNDVELEGRDLQLQEIGTWKRIIRLDNSVADREETSVREKPGGWILTMHPSLLDNLEKDPESQRQLVKWIQEGPKLGEE